MSKARLAALTCLAMTAFASNSLLCRVALKHTRIDAASFTTIRLASGAAMLWLVARWGRAGGTGRGSWLSAAGLFGYAAGFSFAYVSLPAATGALLLFGAVQATMIGHGIRAGERFTRPQLLGLVLALGGLVGLLLPGLSAPPLSGALLMLGAGASWGIYSLRGRGAGDPTRVTAGNFLRAVPIAAALSLLMRPLATLDAAGAAYAVASGALASGLGYAIWYTVLPSLKATTAATVQLSVPVIAASGGVAFLGEIVTARLAAASAAILGGITLVILDKQQRRPTPTTVTIAEERPDSSDALELLAELDAQLAAQPYPPESRHAFSVEKLVRERVAFFVIRCDGEPAGCGGVQLIGREYGEVKRIYVRPARRGAGLGKAMLRRLARHAREHRVGVLRLETGIHQTEAIGLYEAFGFRRRPPFGAYVDDPMSLYFELRIG